MEEIVYKDPLDNLLALTKVTIERLFQLDNASDCVALYVFYCKTAKWQKTKMIKANDLYVQKCLKWGKEKISKTKTTLKECGLIDVIAIREKGIIKGWYIKVEYVISEKNYEQTKHKFIECNHNPYNPLVVEATGGFQDTNAFKEQYKCLLNKLEIINVQIVEKDLKIKQLEEQLLQCNADVTKCNDNKEKDKQEYKEVNKQTNKQNKKEHFINEENFQLFWNCYCNKINRKAAFKKLQQICKDQEMLDMIINAIQKQVKAKGWDKDHTYMPHATTWLNGERWLDEVVENKSNYNNQPKQAPASIEVPKYEEMQNNIEQDDEFEQWLKERGL